MIFKNGGVFMYGWIQAGTVDDLREGPKLIKGAS